jgi:2-dehydro-3-deoxygalactonokinase
MNQSTIANAVICVDMGTTNTRLWLVHGDQIIQRFTEARGVRDAAQSGNSAVVREILRTLIGQAQQAAANCSMNVECILAAGMLTSSLGLHEVPHIAGPAGEVELARAIKEVRVPEASELIFYMVPGVRTGGLSPHFDDLQNVDLMRGEETTLVGLVLAGTLPARGTFLNLGSHWKAISLDENHRIHSSHTTLSGEMIHALQEKTILASALPRGRFETLETEWFEKGRKYQAEAGMGRSLFSVRLLEQVFHADRTQAASFLLGAVIASDQAGMEKSCRLGPRVVIAGLGAAAEAWRIALERTGRETVLCTLEEIESGFLRGLQHLYRTHRTFRTAAISL